MEVTLITTAAEMREAAAQWHDRRADYAFGIGDKERGKKHTEYAAAIRALPIAPAQSCHCRLAVGVLGRVCDGAGCRHSAPAPDREALVRAISARIPGRGFHDSTARAVLAALEAAGALK